MRGFAPLVTGSLVAVSLVGCGGQSTQGDVIASLEALQEAAVSRDYDHLCASVTKPALQQVSAVGHRTPDNCKLDMREAFVALAFTGDGDARRPRVTAVTITGRRATARVSAGPGWSANVPLLREDERWKLDSFFGLASPDARRQTSIATGSPQFPSGEPVTVRTRHGRPCPSFSGKPSTLTGGCGVRTRARGADIPLLTPFGQIGFRDCRIDFRIRIDGTGRTWSRMVAKGPPGNGCDDILGCGEEEGVKRPWPGRIRREGPGRFSHVVAVCFDTCIGHYVGTLRMPVQRRATGWRIELPRGPFETTGLRFAKAAKTWGDSVTLDG